MEQQRGIKIGIGKKLLIYFLVLSLVPIIIGGSISFYITKSQLEKNTKAYLSDRARDCGRKISYYVSSHYQDIKLLSHADVFEGNDTDKKQRYIEEDIDAYPFCENNEPKELGYFVSEEEEGFRLDFCKKCNHYIKTLDMRVIDSPAPLELENLITLHLDMLAHEQGFKPLTAKS